MGGALPSGKPAVLVDRDGTLIRDPGYLTRIEQIEVLAGVAEALRLLKRHELTVAVVTNQSAVARGLVTERELAQIHREIERRLARSGARVDAIYYCPHHPSEGRSPYRRACECRKPSPGLALRAAADLDLDLGRSYVVGDKPIDMELASRIGARGLLIVAEGDVAKRPEGAVAVSDLLAAAERIVEDLGAKK
jgi:D-glycero-D-manno-heptose 1,7-bisphosphate phosphatase